MRTTLDIDEEILVVARSLARARGLSIGAAVSELARRGLMQSGVPPVVTHYSPFPVMVGDERVLATDALVADFRDDSSS